VWVESQAQILVAAERSVLFALNFDFSVDIPEAWVLPAVRALGVPVPTHGREAAGAAGAAAQDLVVRVNSLINS
ncbi:hypothetical protein MNEG_14498, partial [Monoraphidium neglectum]